MRKIWNADEKLQYERALLEKGYRYVIGVGEYTLYDLVLRSSK